MVREESAARARGRKFDDRVAAPDGLPQDAVSKRPKGGVGPWQVDGTGAVMPLSALNQGMLAD
ncbi:hypothetical protein NED98_13835 [Sphingomonas sp. MMSM20]|nr:hypothetical protein [Sphingomonas lycopersici]